ncbi:GNAT family N-acetyltransferase [Pseudoruegeria sp. SHC-113]|uniref:GNAT family N-acetyltransferase n=1 Tax=Pseudoruegeria sp. SHC-113 TaxID=2855439 RepID=UPI0021BAF376|nr:GNAT family N-acetyltransferase [Pseudoruegeria sp. SHC-113]MCT8159192.1 GNAT family N-acetyltransferase [Pseudoruegeria sp. SHC-113]
MTLTIAAESPLTPDAAALIEGSEAALREVYSEDECFTFTAAELAAPGITFLVARTAGGTPAGCVALCECDGYGEVKRLYVTPQGRGRGTARALMADLEARASALGLPSVKLETGEKLAAAVALYSDLGYTVRGPFGAYEEHPASLFMEKPLRSSD